MTAHPEAHLIWAWQTEDYRRAGWLIGRMEARLAGGGFPSLQELLAVLHEWIGSKLLRRAAPVYVDDRCISTPPPGITPKDLP